MLMPIVRSLCQVVFFNPPVIKPLYNPPFIIYRYFFRAFSTSIRGFHNQSRFFRAPFGVPNIFWWWKYPTLRFWGRDVPNRVCFDSNFIEESYHLVMTNSLTWKITMLLIGKPSISMGHLYHGELLVITRGYLKSYRKPPTLMVSNRFCLEPS